VSLLCAVLGGGVFRGIISPNKEVIDAQIPDISCSIDQRVPDYKKMMTAWYTLIYIYIYIYI